MGIANKEFEVNQITEQLKVQEETFNSQSAQKKLEFERLLFLKEKELQ